MQTLIVITWFSWSSCCQWLWGCSLSWHFELTQHCREGDCRNICLPEKWWDVYSCLAVVVVAYFSWRCHLCPVLEVSQLCCSAEIQTHLQNLTHQFLIWKEQVVWQSHFMVKEKNSFNPCDSAQRGNSTTPRKMPMQRSVQVPSCSRAGEWQQHINSALEL